MRCPTSYRTAVPIRHDSACPVPLLRQLPTAGLGMTILSASYECRTSSGECGSPSLFSLGNIQLQSVLFLARILRRRTWTVRRAFRVARPEPINKDNFAEHEPAPS